MKKERAETKHDFEGTLVLDSVQEVYVRSANEAQVREQLQNYLAHYIDDYQSEIVIKIKQVSRA